MDQTVRTVESIVLRSVRSACSNDLPYICQLMTLQGLKLMCNSVNNSISPFFRSQRFEFKGISLRIQWCLKALFANWLRKILKIKSVTVYVANTLFVCLVARLGLATIGDKIS